VGGARLTCDYYHCCYKENTLGYSLESGACPGSYIGARLKAERAGGVLGEGQQPPAHQLWDLESAVSSPGGPGLGQINRARLSKGFPLFSAHLIASPNAISLIVNYHSHWGQEPCAPREYTRVWSIL